jgi:type IV pilus assembly protein PilB
MGVKDVITSRLLGSAEKFSDKQIGDTLQLLVRHGVKRGANAIHIEPHDRFVLVRYRIDGALRGIHKLPRPAASAIMRQLKFLAELNPEEDNAPQEGHYAAEIGEQTIEVRVSLMPILGGEKAVLHLTPQRGLLLSLESLGFWGTNLTILHEALARPYGLITAAGPKHSGKSSTLYGLLQLLNNPSHSIATIEEHATHRLPGANQSYVHAKNGTTTLHALQGVLHQDPNIIMLGNLPNPATAELAIHTAVTGHLLLAEIYADSAVASLVRLRTMGIEPFLLATAFRVGISQRLVRKLCPQCRQRAIVETEEVAELEKTFGISTPASRARLQELEQQAREHQIGTASELHAASGHISHVWNAKEGGCDYCDRTGYKGRMAITEVLKNTDGVQKQLLRHDTPSLGELHKAALKDGFIPMGLDGLIKALRGETTVAEVLRVVAPTM